MKASEKLCVKSFFWGANLRCISESMEYIASHFVSGDVRGYFAGCFSKVEDDVVYYNDADQKKNRSLAECFFSPSFWLYFNGCIYEYGDKVKLMI